MSSQNDNFFAQANNGNVNQNEQPETQLPNSIQQQSGYQVPVELITLPSKGIAYPAGHPLFNERTVEIKSMTAKEEDILTSRALLKNGKLITQLLKSCILNKTVDPDDMLVGDRNAVLIGIRVTGYGAEYSAKISCPECSRDFENTFSLAKLKLKPLETAPLQSNMNIFSYILPSGGTVYFKLLTGRDEMEVASVLEAKKKFGSQIEAGVTTRLLQSIVSINGESDKGKIAKMVQDMRAFDARALRKHIDSVEPGVDLNQQVICPHCDAQSEVTMPLGINFFWPDLGK